MTGQWDDFTLPDGRSGYVYEFLCVGPDGQRSASEVQVFRQSGATLRYVSTRSYPAADQYVSFLVAGGPPCGSRATCTAGGTATWPVT